MHHSVIKFILLLLCVQFCAGLDSIERTFPGYIKGTRFGVSPNSLEHLKAVRWNPERQDIPLPVQKAIIAARKALEKMVGASASYFESDDVGLHRSLGYWYYSITFQSDHSTQVDRFDGGVSLATLTFIVYLDGFVEMPYERKA